MQLILDSKEFDYTINKIKKYSEENILDLTNGIPKDCFVAGDNMNHVCYNGNIRIVYSIEKQPNIGNCHHLSISKNNNRPPNIELVNYILKKFDMGELNDGIKRVYWLEDNYAINIVQPF